MGRGKTIVFRDAYTPAEKHARRADTGKPRPHKAKSKAGRKCS